MSEAGEASELERILRAAGESVAGIPRSRVLRTTDKLFASVAGTETPQGVAAIFRQRVREFDDVVRGAASADGALARRCGAGGGDGGGAGSGECGDDFAVGGGVWGYGRGDYSRSADPWSPKALRASAGSGLRVPLLRGMAVPVLQAQLRVAGVRLWPPVRILALRVALARTIERRICVCLWRYSLAMRGLGWRGRSRVRRMGGFRFR